MRYGLYGNRRGIGAYVGAGSSTKAPNGAVVLIVIIISMIIAAVMVWG